MTLLEKYQILAEEFGLETVLEQNDLTHEDVLRMLHLNGLIDIDEYFFDVLEDIDGDNEV